MCLTVFKSLEWVVGCLLKVNCPVCKRTGNRWPGRKITDDRGTAITCEVTEKTLVGWERGWLTSSLGVRVSTRDGRVADVLHVRTEVARAAVLDERTTALCTLCERTTLHARAEAGKVVERAEGIIGEQTRQVTRGGTRGLCCQECT